MTSLSICCTTVRFTFKVDNHVTLPGLFCTSIRTESEGKSGHNFLKIFARGNMRVTIG